MRVEIKIDKDISEPKVVIYTKEITQEIAYLASNIETNSKDYIIGTSNDGKKFFLNKLDIESFYAENNKTYARLNSASYIVNYKLYELEELFQKTSFVRISNSEIVNFKQIDYFSFKDSTIYIYFKSGNFTYVSRRYIPKIRKYLNIK